MVSSGVLPGPTLDSCDVGRKPPMCVQRGYLQCGMPLLSPQKQFPHLSEYLATLAARERARLGNLGVVGAVVGVTGGLMGALLGILGGFGFIHFSDAEVVFTILGINMACWMIICGFWWAGYRRRAQEDSHSLWHREAVDVGGKMMRAKKLHRQMNHAALDLLEASAESWHDVMALLGSPFWRDPNLPDHWKGVRDQAAAAANQAMEEQLVLLKESFQLVPPKQGVAEFVEDVIENYVTGPLPRKNVSLPVNFEEARQIAEKLRQAAGEIRKATSQVRRTGSMQTANPSGVALDLAMGDLRSISQAEEELRQSTSG